MTKTKILFNSMMARYTQDDGNAVVMFLKEHGFESAELIGSLSKIGYSDKDIDIYIPERLLNDIQILKELLIAESVEDTDWEGVYFKNTQFGDVDIFFSTNDFDY